MYVKQLLKEVEGLVGATVSIKDVESIFEKYKWAFMGISIQTDESEPKYMTFIEGPMDREIDIEVVEEENEMYNIKRIVRKYFADKVTKLVDSCSTVLVSSCEPIRYDTWMRLSQKHFISEPDKRNPEITSKEELNYVYIATFSDTYGIFRLLAEYDQEARDEYIESYYGDLPDVRTVRFAVSDVELDDRMAYFKEEIDIQIFKSLFDIMDSDIDLDDKFIYSVDDAGNMIRVNEDISDDVKPKLRAMALITNYSEN